MGVEKDWFQIMVVLTGSVSMLNCGLSYYWTSPFIPKIVEEKETYNITEEQASYFAVCNLVTLILVPFFLPHIVHRFGKKKSILLSFIPYGTGWLLKAHSVNLWLLYIARLLCGTGDAIIFSLIYPYVGEVASPNVRDFWGNAPMSCTFFGQLLINVLGLFCTVKTTSYICVCILIIFTIAFSFMPETPYFYMLKGQDEEAKNCLRQLRLHDKIHEEFKEIKIAVTEQQSETCSWKDLITVVVHRRALVVALFLRLCQIMSGLFIFGSYTQFIFQKVGTTIRPEYSTLMYTGLNFVLFTIGAMFSNKLGRRKSLLWSLALCGISVLAESVYFFIEKNVPQIDLTPIQWFPLVGMLLFLLFSSFGIGIIPPLMFSELFASNIAAKGCSVLTIAYGIICIAMNSVFYYFIINVGLWGPFLMFGICNFISFVVTYCIIPETKNKTLSEIQHILTNTKMIK